MSTFTACIHVCLADSRTVRIADRLSRGTRSRPTRVCVRAAGMQRLDDSTLRISYGASDSASLTRDVTVEDVARLLARTLRLERL